MTPLVPFDNFIALSEVEVEEVRDATELLQSTVLPLSCQMYVYARRYEDTFVLFGNSFGVPSMRSR